MPTLELTDQQVVDLVKQLPPERKRTAILALAEADSAQRDERMQYAEGQFRRACAEHGGDWADAAPLGNSSHRGPLAASDSARQADGQSLATVIGSLVVG